MLLLNDTIPLWRQRNPITLGMIKSQVSNSVDRQKISEEFYIVECLLLTLNRKNKQLQIQLIVFLDSQT